MSSFVKFLQSFGLLIARIGVGTILLLHAWNRWRHQGIDKQIAYLTQFHTPYPEIAAWAATIFEAVGGVFLILGALTPLVGLAILVEQILIVAYTNWYKGANLMRADGTGYNGGYEYNVALGLLGLLFFVMGGGVVAVDRIFKRKKTDDDDVDTPRTVSDDTVVRV